VRWSRTLSLIFSDRMVRSCGVVHCMNNSNKYPFMRFFAIPRIRKHQHERDEELSRRRRMAWIAALNRTKEDLTEIKLSHTKICEQHFVGGNYKTQNLVFVIFNLFIIFRQAV
jgi:THAP domain